MSQLSATVYQFLDYFHGRPYVQALIVIACAMIVALLMSGFIRTVCNRLTRLTPFRLDNEIAAILHTPIVYTVLMVGLTIAISRLAVPDALHITIVRVLKSINIFIWMVFAVRLSKLLLRASAKLSNRIKIVHIQSLPLFENLSVLLLAGFSIYFVLQVWGINATAWLASAGVLGIAIGFASKDTLSNFIAGIFILADAPYKIGDYVVLDSGERGEITHIGIRSTRMLTRDDVELTIPNSIMGNSKIVNQSGGPYQKFRIRIPVGVAYGTEVDKTRNLLMQAAQNNLNVSKFPEPRVRLRQMGASSLDFELLCWVEHPSKRGLVTDELLSKIYDVFNQHEIEIPYSKQDIYIKESPKPVSKAWDTISD